MLLYQRCIVTKLFKKKQKQTKQNLGLYYSYILLALCFVFKRGLLTSWGDKNTDKTVYSMYLTYCGCVIMYWKICVWGLFQDAFACYGHSSSELIILNHHFSSLHGIELILFMCWIVIAANMNIWTVVALSRNIISIWACILSSFHLNIK